MPPALVLATNSTVASKASKGDLVDEAIPPHLLRRVRWSVTTPNLSPNPFPILHSALSFPHPTIRCTHSPLLRSAPPFPHPLTPPPHPPFNPITSPPPPPSPRPCPHNHDHQPLQRQPHNHHIKRSPTLITNPPKPARRRNPRRLHHAGDGGGARARRPHARPRLQRVALRVHVDVRAVGYAEGGGGEAEEGEEEQGGGGEEAGALGRVGVR